MTALVEEAVSVGDLVRIFTFQQARADMLELTLPGRLAAGRHARRSDRVARRHGAGRASSATPARSPPAADDTLEGRDELLFVTAREADEAALEQLLTHGPAAS